MQRAHVIPATPRPLAFAVVALLLASAAFVFAPPAAAQGADLVQTDPANDVVPVVGGGIGSLPIVVPPTPLPAPYPGGTEGLVGPADLTEVSVTGESPTAISLGYKVVGFARDASPAPQNVVHQICFNWDGTGADYRFVFTYTYPIGASAASLPNLDSVFLDRLEGPCDPFSGATPTLRVPGQAFSYHADMESGAVSLTVARKVFEGLAPNAAQGELAPLPAAGQKFSGVQAHALASQGPGDFMYDFTTPADYTFVSNTGNELVKVVVPNKISANYGIESGGTPMYGVEIGSFQVVPLTIENHLDVAIQPNLTVSIIEGDPGKWQVRTLESIPVAKKTGDEPGRETVSLIVNSEPTVVHKEKVRLMISALDPAQSQHLGAALVDIVAVKPPTVGEATMYFHGTGDSCNSGKRWMNTLATDTSAAGAEIDFRGCNPQGGGTDRLVTTGEIGRTFYPDVPLSRNYVLSTTEAAEATLVMKSVVRVGTETPTDVPVDMVADLVVQVFSGTTPIGQGTLANQAIGGQDTTFTLPVPIQGRILGGSGREVPDEQGLNVRVAVIPQSRTIEYCDQELCGFEGEQEVPSPSGKVFMLFGASKITLPIISSEPAGEILNITASGALMTLRLSDSEDKPKVFTNPGRIVVYNLTVRNEGVNVDTAKISATVNRTGWQVEILPVTEYKLKVGQPRPFNVRVTAPANAHEGEQVRIEVKATSTVDPDASATMPLFVEATTQQQFEDQEIDPSLQDIEKKKGSPGVEAFALIAALVGLGAFLRRRR